MAQRQVLERNSVDAGVQQLGVCENVLTKASNTIGLNVLSLTAYKAPVSYFGDAPSVSQF